LEFVEILKKRRMVRNYSSQPVATESIERIIAAGLRAPSAGFSQGVSFVVVIDPAMRTRIAELAGESEYVGAGFDPWISRAPAHLVIAVTEQAYHDRYQEPDKVRSDGSEIEWPIPFWWVDAGAALMLVLLAAVNEGLAAGFLGVHSIPGLQELLDIPPGVIPIGIVTIGHPLPDRRSGSLARGRKPREQVVHRERWASRIREATSPEAHPRAVTKSGAPLPANRGDV
jgi:nitroreductase